MRKTGQFSLGAYLAMTYTLLVLVGLLGISLYWLTVQEDTAEDVLLTRLKAQARLLAMTSGLAAPSIHPIPQSTSTAAIVNNLRAVLVTPDLRLQPITDLGLTDLQRRQVLQWAPGALAGRTYTYKSHLGPGDTNEILYAGVPVIDPNGRVSGAICLVLALDDFHAALDRLRLWLVGISGLLTAFGLVLGILVAHRFTRPLDQAGRMAALIATGDHSARLPRQGPRELVRLIDRLNEMAEKLEQQEQARRAVLAGVTHELARPLGALRLGVDTLRNGALKDPELAEDLLAEIGRTLLLMEAQVEDFAVSAYPQGTSLRLQLAPLDVKPILHGLYARFWPLAENRGFDLKIDLPEELCLVTADEIRLNQILGNLIDNAFKFTPPGGEILLSARQLDGQVELSVQDSGPGIPPGEVQDLFKPFQRGSNASHVRDGMGLGLSIVQRLVQAHHGQVQVDNYPGGGLLVRVLLPAASPP